MQANPDAAKDASREDGLLLVTQSAGPRSAGGVIDCLLVLVVDFVGSYFAGAGGSIAPGEPLPRLAVILVPIVGFLYFTVCESIWNTTVGKRVFGMTVRMVNGSRATTSACVLRSVMRLVDMLPLPIPVGLVAIRLTARHQRLGDLVAGTIVVSKAALDYSAARQIPTPPAYYESQRGGGEYEQPEPARPERP